MKNKSLPALLLLPFVVSILTFFSIEILQNAVASDILGITWDYDDAEGFEVMPDLAIELRAKAEVDPSAILATGNELVWKASKKDPSAPKLAKSRKKMASTTFTPSRKGKASSRAKTAAARCRAPSSPSPSKMAPWSSTRSARPRDKASSTPPSMASMTSLTTASPWMPTKKCLLPSP